MAEEALQRTVSGPAAVAIHDDGDVLRQALRLQRLINGAFFRVSSWMRKVPEEYKESPRDLGQQEYMTSARRSPLEQRRLLV